MTDIGKDWAERWAYDSMKERAKKAEAAATLLRDLLKEDAQYARIQELEAKNTRLREALERDARWGCDIARQALEQEEGTA